MRFNLFVKTVVVCVAFLSVTFSVVAQEDTDNKAIDDYNFAVWLYNGSKYNLAVESYEDFLQNHPKHEKVVDARFGLGQSFFHLDKFKKAAGQYEIVRSKYEDFSQMPEALFQLAQTRVALEHFGTAETLFSEVRSRHSKHYLADWAMARQAACLISLGKFKEAEDLLKRFIGKYTAPGKSADKVPGTQQMFAKLDQARVKATDAFLNLVEKSVFYHALAQFNQKRFADAEKSFNLFLAQYPESKLLEEARFRLAQSLYQQKAHAKAAAAYKPVADGEGEFADVASFERGLALYKAGKLKDASAVFAGMAKRFPKSPQAPRAQLYSGTFLFEAADYKGAIGRLKPLADAGKELADEAAYWLGMSLLKAGKSAEAEKTFADAMRSFPRSSLAGDIQLGLADAQLAQNKFESVAEAFRDYSQKFQKSDQAPRALYSACVALHRADKYTRSDSLCAKFVKTFSGDKLVTQVLFLSGENRFLLKTYGQAAARYNEFLHRKDASMDRIARAHFRLAWVHMYAKRYEDALAELGKIDVAAADKTILVEVNYLKGVCLFESEKYSKAIQALSAYLKAGDHSRFGDDALLKLAVSHSKRNKKKEAARSFKRFLREYPGSELVTQAQYQLAECYYDLKQYAKGIENYMEVVEHEPAGKLSPYAMFGLGMCYYDQGKWAESVKTFGYVTDKFKNSELVPQAFYRKGRGLVKLKKWAEAEQAFRALLTAAPNHELARTAQITVGTCLQEQKKWVAAAAAFKAVIDKYPEGKDQAGIYYEQAWSWREAGKEDNALAVFGDLAENFPKDAVAADAYFYLAEAKYREKSAKSSKSDTPEQRTRRLDEARALYENVLAVSKDKRLADKVHYRIGWCYWLIEKYNEAAAEFDKLIKDFPHSDLLPDALFQAGQSYARTGKPVTAIERFEQLIGNSKFADFKYLSDAYLGLSDCKIILSRPTEAIEHLTVIIAKYNKPHAPAQAHFLMGKAQFDLKQYDSALASFNEVTRHTKSELGAEAQFYIGQVLQSKQDYKAAVVAYLRVLALYPQYKQWVVGATFESGKCYAALGDNAEARKAYQSVVNNYKDTKWAGLAAERLK